MNRTIGCLPRPTVKLAVTRHHFTPIDGHESLRFRLKEHVKISGEPPVALTKK